MPSAPSASDAAPAARPQAGAPADPTPCSTDDQRCPRTSAPSADARASCIAPARVTTGLSIRCPCGRSASGLDRIGVVAYETQHAGNTCDVVQCDQMSARHGNVLLGDEV